MGISGASIARRYYGLNERQVMDMKIEVKVNGERVEPALIKRLDSICKSLWGIIPGGAKRYYGVRGWQRSCRNHAVKSRVRHAKRKAVRGYRYKGGK